ncbi:MAG: hypothetical protein WB562_06335 [Candidatus Sulfotelmatobacter sp.]
MRCKPPQKRIDTHRTQDSASPLMANGPLRTALFRPGTAAQCKCSAGECSPEDCDELWIFDETGTRIACFYGSDFRATDEENSGGSGVSGLCVYKMPARTEDAAIDKAVLQIRQRLHDINVANAAFWQQSPGAAAARTGDAMTPLARLNQKNAEFYKEGQ